jgi:hypothetical protein
MLFSLNVTLKRVMLFLVIFLLVSPLGELSFIGGTRYDDGDLELYCFSLLIAFLIVFLFIIKVKSKIVRIEEVKNSKILFFVTLFSFLLFLFFVFKSSDGISSLPFFAAKYRQGFFKGSGIYTFPILTIIPSILIFFIIKVKKLDRFFVYSLILVFLATFIVGLRIYLFGIFFFFMIRLFSTTSNLKIILITLPLVIIMMSYKYYLNEDTGNLSGSQSVFYFLGRLNLRTLLEFNGLTRDISELKCAFFPINYMYGCDNEEFKNLFLQGQEDVRYGMSYIGKYSGVALPLPVILYNLFGFFSVLFLIPYLLFTFWLISITLKSKKVYSVILCSIFSGILIMALVEDINVINKSFIMFVISFFLFFFIKKYFLKKE